MSRVEANKWFGEVLPAMADLLLRLPLMLEAHYKNADAITCVGARDGLKTGLRMLKSQEAGVVLLSQVRNHTTQVQLQIKHFVRIAYLHKLLGFSLLYRQVLGSEPFNSDTN